MNIGKYLTLCDCPHICDAHSYSRWCFECQTTHKRLIRKQVINEKDIEYETYER